MKKIHRVSIISVFVLAISVFLFLKGEHFFAVILSLLAYLLTVKNLMVFTGNIQAVMLMIVSLIPAFFIEFPFNKIPLLGMACVLTNLPLSLRVIFYRKFSMTRFLWMEVLLTGISVALYFSGNIYYSYNADLERWLFPVIPLGVTGTIAFGMLRDTKGLFAHARKGYGVNIGSAAPYFELPDQNGQIVKLSDFSRRNGDQKGKNLLLIFVRGDWCPWCHMMLRTYQKEKTKFQERDIVLLAIGPDPLGVNRQMAEKLGIDFTLLSDDKQKIAMRYGCQLSREEDKNLISTNPVFKQYEEGIPLPASFLVDRNGIVKYISRPDRVGEFLEPDTIFPVLASMS